MKLVHNVRFTAVSNTPAERLMLAQQFEKMLGIEIGPHVEFEDLKHPGLETLYSLKVWFDKQSLVRSVQERIFAALSLEDRDALVAESHLHIDEQLYFSFRLSKQDFLEGKIKFVLRGDVIQVRINFAAFPKTKERVAAVVEELFSK